MLLFSSDISFLFFPSLICWMIFPMTLVLYGAGGPTWWEGGDMRLDTLVASMNNAMLKQSGSLERGGKDVWRMCEVSNVYCHHLTKEVRTLKTINIENSVFDFAKGAKKKKNRKEKEKKNRGNCKGKWKEKVTPNYSKHWGNLVYPVSRGKENWKYMGKRNTQAKDLSNIFCCEFSLPRFSWVRWLDSKLNIMLCFVGWTWNCTVLSVWYRRFQRKVFCPSRNIVSDIKIKENHFLREKKQSRNSLNLVGLKLWNSHWLLFQRGPGVYRTKW